jgi:hypothetical protein
MQTALGPAGKEEEMHMHGQFGHGVLMGTGRQAGWAG